METSFYPETVTAGALQVRCIDKRSRRNMYKNIITVNKVNLLGTFLTVFIYGNIFFAFSPYFKQE